MIRFFDSNCCVGKLAVPLPAHFGDMEELAAVMERSGIDDALVYHALGKEYSPATGNQLILDDVRGYPNMHPCWCVLPPYTGEIPPPWELVDLMRTEGVRAVRIFPKTHNWSLAEWSAGELLDALEKHAIPLFIDFAETSCDQVHALCEKHPRLPVVLTGTPFRLSRLVYALLARTTNLHIELSAFQLHCGIEDICARFGARRLLFGSAAPHFNPAPSVMAVKYSGTTEAEKALIASGNLQRLLDSVLE